MKATASRPRGDDVPEWAIDLRDELLREMRSLRDAFERQRQESLGASEREEIEALIAPIAGAYGSTPFFVADLADETAPAIRMAIGKRTRQQIGQLLSRATDVDVNGLVVKQDGRVLGAVRWRIVAALGGRLGEAEPLLASLDTGRGGNE